MLKRVLLLGIIVAALSVHLISTLDYEIGVITSLIDRRSMIVTAMLGLVGLMQVRRLKILPTTSWYGLFALYCFISLLAHGLFLYALMFLVWCGYTCVVFPNILATVSIHGRIRLTQALLFMLGLVLVGIYLYAQAKGIDLAWGAEHGTRARFTSGLANPTIYSRTVFVGILLACFCFLTTDKWRYAGLAIFGTTLLVATDVRSEMAGLGFATLMFFLEWRQFSIGKYVAWFLGGFTVVAGLIYLGVSYRELDMFASTRLSLWSYIIENTYLSDPVVHLFFGTGASVLPSGYHYDNTLLEVVGRYGVVGLGLLSFGLYQTMRQLSIRRRNSHSVREERIYVWAKAALYGLMASSLFTTILPSIGNAPSLLLFPFIIAIAHAPLKRSAHQKRSAGQTVRSTPSPMVAI